MLGRRAPVGGGRRSAAGALGRDFASVMCSSFTCIYLLTVGHSFREHVKPMITGFDKIDLTAEEEAYLEADEPARIR